MTSELNDSNLNLRDFLDEQILLVQKKIAKIKIGMENNILDCENQTEDADIVTIVNSCVKRINLENTDVKFEDEKPKRRNSISRKSSLRKSSIKKEAKEISRKSFDQILNNPHLQDYITNYCMVCDKKKMLSCLFSNDHYPLKEIIRHKRGYGPLSLGNIYEYTITNDQELVCTQKESVYSLDSDLEKNEYLKYFRGDLIVQEDQKFPDAFIREKQMVFTRLIKINELGVAKSIDMSIEGYEKDNDLLLKALIQSYITYRRISETQVVTSYEYTSKNSDLDKLLVKYTVTEPNVINTFNKIMNLRGIYLHVCNTAMIFFRLVIISDKDRSEFLEPVYVRWYNESIIIDKRKGKNDDKYDKLYYCCYLTTYKENERDHQVVRSMLCPLNQVYELGKRIAEELTLSNIKRPLGIAPVIPLRDRNICSIVHIKKKNSYSLDEYQMMTPLMKTGSDCPEIKQIEESSGCHRFSWQSEKKGSKGRYTITFESKIAIEAEFSMTHKEFIKGPNFGPIITSWYDMKTSSLQKTTITRNSEPLFLPDFLKKKVREKILKEFDWLTSFSLKTKACYEENLNGKDRKGEFYFKNIIIIYRPQDENYSVKNLKDSKGSRNYLKNLCGIYRCVENKKDNTTKIHVDHKTKVIEEISRTDIGKSTSKEILKTVLNSKKGDLIVDLEQRTDIFQDNSLKKTLLLDPDSYPPYSNEDISKILCDTVVIEETPSYMEKNRVLILDDSRAIRSRVVEPNLISIMNFRLNVLKVSDIAVPCGRYCEKSQITGYFEWNLEDKLEVADRKKDTNEHESHCSYFKYGNFGIESKIQFFEEDIKDFTPTKYDFKDYLREERTEVKFVRLVCEDCEHGKILLKNVDIVTDACNFTLFRQKLSAFDFFSAVEIFMQQSKLSPSDKRDAVIMSRFKNRMQRCILTRLKLD